MKATFRNPRMQRFYEDCRRLAADQTSGFWYDDGKGGRTPHRGAGHRVRYWNGRSGLPFHIGRISPADRQLIGYAAWLAGRHDLLDFGPVEASEYRR